jgi:nitrate reductase (NAD(P)H)
MAQCPMFATRTFPTGNSALKGPSVSFQLVNYSLTSARLVEKPITLSFKQILQNYDQITAPITLVCAGNRRKEQNTVRKSKGFSWGSAALSTALFTGPMMADIIKSAKPLRRAKYVCMEGADNLVCPRE